MTSRTNAHVSAVVLAAGTASRAGVTKQLLQLHDKPLLQHVIDNARSSSVSSVVVVLGHDVERVEAEIDTTCLVVVHNDVYAEGQATSLIAGINALPADTGAVIVLLGDQPGIDAHIIDRVVTAWRESDARYAVADWQGIRGNPVVIDRAAFDDVRSLKGDTGARALFQQYPESIVSVEFDRPMPPDVDTLDDYRALTAPQAK